MATMIRLLLLVPLLLVGCNNDYESQRSKVEKLFSSNKIGLSTDFYLVKSSFGTPDRVAVVFGFMDDGAFCNEIATMYMNRYPSDQYYCAPAN